MKKLYLITRDGKALNDFIGTFGLSKDRVKAVKTVRDLSGASSEDSYVVIPAKRPDGYHWAIRPELIRLNLKNRTKFYINKLNKI